MLDPNLLKNPIVKDDRKDNIRKLKTYINMNKFSDFNTLKGTGVEDLKLLDDKIIKLAKQSYLLPSKIKEE